MGLALEESVDEENEVVEKIDGLQFVCEEKVVPHVQGKILDYHQDEMNEGFTIYDENPGSCDGCC